MLLSLSSSALQHSLAFTRSQIDAEPFRALRALLNYYCCPVDCWWLIKLVLVDTLTPYVGRGREEHSTRFNFGHFSGVHRTHMQNSFAVIKLGDKRCSHLKVVLSSESTFCIFLLLIIRLVIWSVVPPSFHFTLLRCSQVSALFSLAAQLNCWAACTPFCLIKSLSPLLFSFS